MKVDSETLQPIKTVNEIMPSAFSLAAKVAVVTGGASGIGAAIAAAFARAGATVVIADIDRDGAAQLARELVQAGLSADAIALDLGDETSVVAACAEVVTRHGAPWALVNNAGLQDREPFLEGTAAEWDRMNRVNARGPFLMTRELARAMVQAGSGGRIINIASAVLQGSIVNGLVAYAASKGALLGLSGASAFELAAHGITVNTVLPGGVPTPGAMAAKGPPPSGPARRPPPLGLCEPGDIAAAALFFATPAARRITNQVLAVDAGFSLT